uniref:Reverse transcriptase Ty1/copia-type domain-containing protein n=1 Tax=Ananas comosus var. bracteatus TaxID=296719 RepID=A0A6V7P9M8_ANACO|nr:unnamed protein product [Ananas comosus var. bracteatus]
MKLKDRKRRCTGLRKHSMASSKPPGLMQGGFSRSESDPTLYVKTQGTEILIVSLYIDDLIYIGNSQKLIDEFRSHMIQEFEMTDLDLMNHKGKKGIFVSQKKYISNLLDRFGLKDCNLVTNPLGTNMKFSIEDSAEKVYPNVYRSLIRSLLYVVHTRPNIMFATSLLSRFMEYPSKIHVGATKWILRYLKGTSDHGLWFTKANNFSLFGFFDSDWESSINDRRSTSGFAFKLGSSTVCWSSKKQHTTALSSSEAEYVALTGAACQAI